MSSNLKIQITKINLIMQNNNHYKDLSPLKLILKFSIKSNLRIAKILTHKATILTILLV